MGQKHGTIFKHIYSIQLCFHCLFIPTHVDSFVFLWNMKLVTSAAGVICTDKTMAAY